MKKIMLGLMLILAVSMLVGCGALDTELGHADHDDHDHDGDGVQDHTAEEHDDHHEHEEHDDHE